jgi:hypothetical protein
VERLEGKQRATLAADKGYDTREFVQEMRGVAVMELKTGQ